MYIKTYVGFFTFKLIEIFVLLHCVFEPSASSVHQSSGSAASTPVAVLWHSKASQERQWGLHTRHRNSSLKRSKTQFLSIFTPSGSFTATKEIVNLWIVNVPWLFSKLPNEIESFIGLNTVKGSEQVWTTLLKSAEILIQHIVQETLQLNIWY